MSDRPLLSVVVPVHNGARFVCAAISSIRSQQGFTPEIVIVDDGSTDGSARIAHDMGGDVRLVSQDRQGPSAARNAGIQASGGDMIGFLDVDDLWKRTKLAVQVPLLEHPRTDVVWGSTQVMMLSEASPSNDGFVPFEEPRSYPQLGSFLFRRSVFDRVGFFDPSLRFGEDVEFLTRVIDAGMEVHRHDDVVLEWRRHSANITNDVAAARMGLVRIVKRMLDTRRTRQAESE